MIDDAAPDHVGEWRVPLAGATPEALFEQAALAIATAAGPLRGAPGGWESVAVSGRDPEALLVAWCNELIGRGEVAGRAYGDVRALSLRESATGRWSLEGEVRGPPAPKHPSPLKAATLHGLRIERARDGTWHADLLFDV